MPSRSSGRRAPGGGPSSPRSTAPPGSIWRRRARPSCRRSAASSTIWRSSRAAPDQAGGDHEDDADDHVMHADAVVRLAVVEPPAHSGTDEARVDAHSEEGVEQADGERGDGGAPARRTALDVQSVQRTLNVLNSAG